MNHMSDEPHQVVRSLGTHEQIPNLCCTACLLSDMQGAMEYRPTSNHNIGRHNFSKYEKRLEKIAPTIIKMRADGKTRKEIRESLVICNATLTKYIHDINEWGLGKC